MKFFLIAFFVIFSLQSCNNHKTQNPNKILAEVSKADDFNRRSLNFQFTLPKGWYRLDTVIQNVALCVLIKNDADYVPRINITNEMMHGKNHNDYVLGTKEYLANNMAGIDFLQEGNFETNSRNCLWYTYNKTQNGFTREMIYYSVEVANNVSYNITAGVNTGGRALYSKTFDEIVKSFKLAN